jgi:hypothetical protein
MIQSGDLLGTLASAAFGHRWQSNVLNTRLSWGLVRENVSFLFLNLPTPNALLFFVGIVALLKMKSAPAFRYLVAALMVLFFAFAFRYTIADRYAFFIPFYALVAVVIGLGAHRVQEAVRHQGVLVLIAGFSLLPVAVYAAAPDFAKRIQVTLPTRGDVPHRDDYTYFLRPWKTGYRGAERFAREALAALPADAVVYADTTTVGPLLYAQEIQNQRPDVWIITGLVRSEGAPHYGPDAFDRLVGRRPVYVTSPRPGYCPPFVLDRYELAKSGVLWRVVKPDAPAG